jgi:ATP-binding cassette subfamily B (MDR/TAP) protein 1
MGDQNETEPPSLLGYQDSRLPIISESPIKRKEPIVSPSGSSANDPKPKPEDNTPILTEKVGACGYFELFNKGGRSMMVLVVLGNIFAAGEGVTRGLGSLMVGEMIGGFGIADTSGLTESIAEIALKTVIFGIACVVFSMLSKYIWTYLQNTLSHRVKFLYFSKILEKDMGWYDRKSPEKITSQYNIDSLGYEEGVGYANGQMSYTLAVSLTCIAISFYKAPIYA